MKLPFGFDEFLTDLSKLQDLMAQVHAEAAPSKEKDLLGQYLTHVNTARVDVERTYPEAIGAIQASMKKTEAGIAAAREELAAALQQASAAVEQASMPAPAPVVAVKPDPQLGTSLRAELLALFGSRRGRAAEENFPQREAWQDWESLRHP